MGEQNSITRGVQTLAFESLGVRLVLTADTPEVFDRLPSLLPPDAKFGAPDPEDPSFGVHQAPDGSYGFTRDGSPVASGTDLDFSLSLLKTQIRIYIGIHAPDRIFVHAGVVAHLGRAIVLPGRSFTGKTSLVLALVRAGATYYSDEFAVIDSDGRVHPYTHPPSVRNPNPEHLESFQVSTDGAEQPPPIPVGLVLFSEYRPRATWTPRELSQGRGTLGMFSNTLAALQRTEEAMRVLSGALNDAVILEGERGDADEIAAPLLRRVSGPPAAEAVGRS